MCQVQEYQVLRESERKWARKVCHALRYLSSDQGMGRAEVEMEILTHLRRDVDNDDGDDVYQVAESEYYSD